MTTSTQILDNIQNPESNVQFREVIRFYYIFSQCFSACQNWNGPVTYYSYFFIGGTLTFSSGEIFLWLNSSAKNLNIFLEFEINFLEFVKKSPYARGTKGAGVIQILTFSHMPLTQNPKCWNTSHCEDRKKNSWCEVDLSRNINLEEVNSRWNGAKQDIVHESQLRTPKEL